MQTKSSEKSAEEVVVGSKAKKAAASPRKKVASTKRVRDYKMHAKRELSEAFPEIVDVLVERAKEGSLTHAKFLFDIGGIKDKQVSSEDREGEPSFSQLLLREVAKRNEEAAAEALAEEAVAV